jgi:hypothetical protein
MLAGRRAGGSELREGLTEAQRGLRRRSCGQPRRPGRVACSSSSPLRLGCFYVSALGPGRGFKPVSGSVFCFCFEGAMLSM